MNKKLTQNHYSSIRPGKSFYAPKKSIPIPSTENPLISPYETLIMTKSTNLSPDHQTTSQNCSNLTYASTDDLHAEMIAIKIFE